MQILNKFKSLLEKFRQWWYRDLALLADRLEAIERLLNAEQRTIVQTVPVVGAPSKLEPSLAARLAAIEGQLVALQEGQKAGFYNQIVLSNNKPGLITLSTPWPPTPGVRAEPVKKVFLERLPSGRLCFAPPTPGQDEITPPIFVTTVPKSGTWFLMAVLKKLGFQDPKISPLNERIADQRGLAQLFNKPQVVFEVPYHLQVELTQPGQILLGHVHFTPMKETHGGGEIILTLRDLRVTLISWFRFIVYNNHLPRLKQIPAIEELAPDDFYHFLKTHAEMNNIVNFFHSAVQFLNSNMDISLVRFEELNSADRNKMRPSAESIAKVTKRPLEEVLKAIESCRGQKTNTYTGQLSELGHLWTKEVEALFVEKGWHIMNERLGYPRDYDPDYYKSA